ncbi:uncharacterized protein LOC134851445 [Symsagittifera roscoffensis]|uniref:uncharacterized protein LOC134851445 n=1 Tax=Symsagittifera roscoffensis TaxID=84072 RepID=UPI00307BEC41
MCVSNTPCCVQVCLLLLWTSVFFSSVLLLFLHSSFQPSDYTLHYVVGTGDSSRNEFLLPFPKWFCSRLTLNQTDGPEGKICVVQPKTPTDGNNKKIKVSHKNQLLPSQGKSIISQTLKSKNEYPGIDHDMNSTEGFYFFNLKVSVADQEQTSAVAIGVFDSYSQAKAALGLSGNNDSSHCLDSPTHLVQPGQNWNLYYEENKPRDVIVVMCPQNKNQQIYAWYDLEVVKYNTVLSSDMSCQDYNDDFNVHYCHGSNTCSVGLVLLTTDDLDYFSYDLWTMWTPIALMSDSDLDLKRETLTSSSSSAADLGATVWSVSCHFRMDVLAPILAAEVCVTVTIFLTSCMCCRRAKNPY